jgi:hypothetical protein
MKNIIINNFIGGLSWAVGATLGISFIIFVLANIFRNANWIPFVGDLVVDITNYVLSNIQNSPQLVK